MVLKVVTIGAGFFAGLHIEAWARNPDADLAGIVDFDTDKAEALAAAHVPKAQVYASAKDALEHLQPDIVDIATPPQTHAELVELADTYAPKAIICQKPFCGGLAKAQEVTRSTSSLLIVHENFRFQPWYRTMKEVIGQGQLGEIYQITFRLRPGDGQGPDAYLDRQPYFQDMERFLVHETGIHWIDTFRYLLGEPVSVYADLIKRNPAIKGEDSGTLLFEFDNGTRAVFDGNRLADHPAANTRLTMGECLIEGSKGTLNLDGFGQIYLRPFASKAPSVVTTSYVTDRFGGDCVYAFQRHVTDHLLYSSTLENTAEDYLRNLEIEELVYSSAENGRKLPIPAAQSN